MNNLVSILLGLAALVGGFVLAGFAAVLGSTFIGRLLNITDRAPLRLIGGVCGAAALFLAAYIISVITDTRPGPGMIGVILFGLVVGVNMPTASR